jgi:hypothetical protein
VPAKPAHRPASKSARGTLRDTSRAGADSLHAAPLTPFEARRQRLATTILDSLLMQADSLLALRGGSRADSARLYLTWNAPYGMPRASRSHFPRAHDPTSADTLWLSFLPGRTSEGFLGFSADLYFRAAHGDTLGPWWHMESSGQNPNELRVEFGPDAETFPQPQPWAVGGTGGVRLYRTPASGRLNINFAVPYMDAVPIAPDSVYTLCRVVLQHHRVLPGCSQPVCIEWNAGVLGYWLKDDPRVNKGERFVSYASDTSVCDEFVHAFDLPGEDSGHPDPPRRPERR